MTLRELSKQLNLSITTVSDSLKDRPSGYVSLTTRERVRREAARLGYQPNVHARRLVKQRAENVVTLFAAMLPDYVLFLNKALAVQRAVSGLGFEVTLAFGHRNVSDTVEMFAAVCRQRPAAIIAFTALLMARLTPQEADTLRLLAQDYIEAGGHFILLDDIVDLPGDRILFDRRLNTGLAARHLLEIGHRRLGIYLESGKWPDGERGLGIRDALHDFGVAPESVRVYKAKNIAGYETGAVLFEEYFADAPANRPTGLVLLNDETAAGFLTAAREAGVRIPEEVSVVGHDNHPWGAHLTVPLTTVTHPYEKIAEAAAHLAYQRITGAETGPSHTIVIGSELVKRASTAPPLVP
jgi:DNA-binding LacI/PurR family transcriptional regulator